MAGRCGGAWRTLAFFALLGLISSAQAQDRSAPLDLVQTVSLGDVQGKIDHLAIDVEGKRLFVATTGAGSVQVVDLAAGKVVHQLKDLPEPQGIAYLPDLKRIAVACGKDGSCRVFDGISYALLGTLGFKDDGDNVRYDPGSKHLWVAHEAGGLGIVDARSLEKLGDIRLDAHPESFQLEKNGARIFVNVPDARHIAVIDREKAAVVAKWPLEKLEENFPMALDEANHRLFIGCRNPAKLLVLDSDSGREVAQLSISRDTDDLFYDPAAKRLYVSAGEGFLDTIEQRSPDRYKRIWAQSTVAGARTSIFAPELGRLYLAVPGREDQKAEIRVYAPKP